MSVSLSPMDDPEGESIVDMDNRSFALFCVAAGVDWNGCHDGQILTPEQLVKLSEAARSVPEFLWEFGLLELARRGGAVLT